MRKYRGSSGESRQQARRAQLIDAAIAVYSEHGREGASVRRICHEAGLSERYFYESFANGADLLAAAFDFAAGAFEYQLLALGDGSTRRALLAAYYTAMRDHPVLSRLFVIEAPAAGGPITERSHDALARFGRILGRVPHDTTVARTRQLLLTGVAGGISQIAREWIGEDFVTPLDTVLDAAEQLCILLEETDHALA